MQIVGVEHGRVLQPLKVEDLELPALELDQPVFAQLLERPVDVDGGKPGRVREIVLRQGEVANPAMRTPDGFEPEVNFDQQMREAL